MKKLNDALNEVHDKYIDEAAKADRLEHSTAKTVRNIAIPVASAAAVAGLCIGLNSMGVFGGKQGIDLVPADSGSSANASTSQTVPYEPNDYQYELIGYLPAEIPLSLQTQSDIESIIFGSEFPEMLYADEEKAIFTEGIGGVYVFDFTTEQITLAADIYDSLYLSVDEFNYRGEGSWNGVSIFALEDGTICCSLAAKRFSTISSHTDYDYEFYVMDMENLKLVRGDDMHEYELDLYDGLFDIPYGEGYSEMSLNGARIGDTGEFVYIRNCTADIDLAPMYNMQYIELRRWTEGEPADDIANHMEGCWFPFDEPVGKEATIFSEYITPEEDSGMQNHLYINATEFSFDTWGSIARIPQGEITVKGDILKLVEDTSGYIWLYRIEGDELIALNVEDQVTLPEYSSETIFTNERLVKAVNATAIRDVLDDNSEEMEDLIDNIEHQKDALESDLEVYEELLQDLYDRIDAYKAQIVELEALEARSDIDSAELDDIRNEIDIMTQAMNKELENCEDVEAVIAQYEERLDSVESELSELQSRYQSEEMADALTDYMKEHLGADTVKTGDAPVFSDILEEWGIITTYYGYDEWRGGTHYGIDIAADGGTGIFAAADGIAHVPQGNSDLLTAFGNLVIIEHENGWFTVYAHANDIVVSEGEKVTAGQEIAHVGSTGWSTGNHLHFEVRKGIEAVDPLDHIVIPSETYSNFNAIIDEKKAELSPTANIPQLAAPIKMELATLTERVYGNGGYYNHNGIDIAAEYGTPVYAVADGKVVAADWLSGYGKCVILQHDGYLTLYAHLDELDTALGNDIKTGEQLGSVGSTGLSTGNHLHFAIITASDEIVDPTEYLPEFLNDTSFKYE